MPKVAEQLRQAREARSLTVPQVAEITKMRTDHLRALEEGNYNVFSAPVYIKGFVRTYATLLKLDVPQVMSALEIELGQTQKFAEPPSLTGERRGFLDLVMLQLSKIDWQKGAIVLGGIVVLVALVIGVWTWRRHKATDPLSGLKPGIYQPGKGQSGETAPVAPPPTQRR